MKKLRDYQQKAIDAINNRLKAGVNNQMLVLGTGCHAINTPILMSNGTIKMVQDIIVGDKIMGDDSTERNVKLLVRGKDKMYKIIPTKGESFVVNENHILSLKKTNESISDRNKKTIVNISVKDYINTNKNFKHLHKLYRASIDLPNIGSPTHPYWIGLWLGDGTVDRPNITIPDKEIEEWFFGEFKEFCSWNHPEIIIKKNVPQDRCLFFTFTCPNHQQHNTNSLLDVTRSLYVNNEKRILDRLLRGDKDTRLQLLAGLIDSDGHYSGGCFEIITKYEGLKNDILFLARSLGLAAYFSNKTGTIKSINFTGEYFRIRISGEISEIPCKIERKKSSVRKQIKNVLVTGFQLQSLPEDNYFGFQIDGNHLYCMGDFTVTHNCGKTFTAVKAISQFKKRLWVTHTEELIEQSGSALLKELYPNVDIQTMIDTHGGLSDYIKAVKGYGMFSDLSDNEIIRGIGIIKAEAFDIESDIVIASAQTLHRRLDKIAPETFDAVVADECHLFMSATFSKALRHFKPKLLCGLTATPLRSDGAQLADLFDEIVYQYNMSDGIEDGYLCEFDAIQVKTDLSLDNVRTTAGEFNQKDLKQTVDTPVRNKLLVDKYKQYCDGKQNIVFCVDVEHAKNVCKTFKDAGYKAEFVVGDQELTSDRKAVINRFKNKETQILVNVQILVAGFDYPGIEVLTVACPTKSLTKFIQIVGRGARTLPGIIDQHNTPQERIAAIKASAKPHCTILDIVDTTTKHRIINTWSLDRDVPIEKRVFCTQEKKQKMIEVREKRKFEAQTKKDTRVNLFKLPTVKYSNSIKMKDPASEKQVVLLERLGYDTANNSYTKADANKLISDHPATKAQIKFLRWKGYDVSNGVTKAEATLAFDAIKAKESKAKEQTELNKILPIQGLD